VSVIAVIVVVAAGATVVVIAHHHHRRMVTVSATCTFTGPSGTFTLTADQARYAATIAAVGGRDGLPDHAVSVALATALQESQLLDLPYGDRDSVGLFQQRPSQGWGTRTELLDPVYAANAFYRALAKVPGWMSDPVTVAAQDVQRSGAPTAYAAWASEGRAVAEALTGEVAAGVDCRYADATSRPTTGASGVAAEAAAELGGLRPATPLPSKDGWRLAGWLVARSYGYGIDRVTYAGRVWTPSTGTWAAEPRTGRGVRFTLAPA
jgi:hypothetical protein